VYLFASDVKMQLFGNEGKVGKVEFFIHGNFLLIQEFKARMITWEKRDYAAQKLVVYMSLCTEDLKTSLHKDTPYRHKFEKSAEKAALSGIFTAAMGT
jgi:hypothetical protein